MLGKELFLDVCFRVEVGSHENVLVPLELEKVLVVEG